MNPRRRPLVVLLVLAVAVAAAGYLLPDPATVVAEAEVGEASTLPATSGVWYCPPAGEGADQVSLVAAAPPTSSRPSQYVVNPFGAPDLAGVSGELFPGAGFDRILEEPGNAIEVRWSDRPVVVSRLSDHGGEVPGVVAGPCASSVSTTWYVPGLTTAAGATARLDIANPFSSEAAVAIDFLTGAGPEAPLATQNVPVPAEGAIEVDLAEVMPQREDLVVRVRARAGRVAVTAEQQSVPTINGVSGRAMVTPVDQPATSWLLPWVSRPDDNDAGLGGQDEPTEPPTEEPTEEPTDPEDVEVVVEGVAEPRSWLWIANPSQEPAELDLTLLTESGPVEPELVTPLEVDPGTTLRVDLEPLLADIAGDVGAAVRSSNDVPVVASGGAVLATGAGVERTGLASLAAHPRPDTSWTLTAPAGPSRRQLLTIANPTDDRAMVNVSAWTGVTSVRPADLQELTLPPGHTLTVDLAERGLTASSATTFVTTVEGQVTASLRSADEEGPLALTVVDGVPSRVWVSSGIATSVHREDGMVNRYGTDLGLPDVAPSVEPTDPADGGFSDEGSVDETRSPDPTPTSTPTSTEGTEPASPEGTEPASPEGTESASPDTSPTPSPTS